MPTKTTLIFVFTFKILENEEKKIILTKALMFTKTSLIFVLPFKILENEKEKKDNIDKNIIAHKNVTDITF